MKGQTRAFIGWLIGLVPVGVLFTAAILKGLDPLLFADQISAHKVTPATWSIPLAYLFIAVELMIGVALLLRLWPRWSHLAFIGLMLGFIVVTAIAWAHGNTKECGCFGRAVGQGPASVIIRDIVLIAISAVAIWLLRGVKTLRWSVILAAILFPLVIIFTAAGAKLPADSLVTGVTKGDDMSDLPIEALRDPHTEGLVLLVLVEEDCSLCSASIPDLNEIADRYKGALRVAAVYSGTRREAMAWRMKHLPAFQVAHASPRALRAYYRALPTCFLLKDGRLVHATWTYTPTSADLAPLMSELGVNPPID